MTAFLVDTKTPGYEAREITDKLGTWAAPTGEITFENCRVPKESILGQEGDGFKICMSMLDNTRLSCAAGGLGLAQACLDASLQYANERTQFGQPIGRFQMVQDMIAQMVVDVEALRLMIYRAAYQKDQGIKNTFETSQAKYMAGEVANKCADFAIKIFGSYGYSEEYPVARFYRDVYKRQITS